MIRIMDTDRESRPKLNRARNTCRIEGCADPAVRRAMCEPHASTVVSWNGKRADHHTTTRVMFRDADGRKSCTKCLQWLPETAFSRATGKADGLGSRCMRCNVLAQYGLDRSSYDALLKSQGGGCAICGGISPAALGPAIAAP